MTFIMGQYHAWNMIYSAQQAATFQPHRNSACPTASAKNILQIFFAKGIVIDVSN